jgi:protein associated with RNAse G/E
LDLRVRIIDEETRLREERLEYIDLSATLKIANSAKKQADHLEEHVKHDKHMKISRLVGEFGGPN